MDSLPVITGEYSTVILSTVLAKGHNTSFAYYISDCQLSYSASSLNDRFNICTVHWRRV